MVFVEDDLRISVIRKVPDIAGYVLTFIILVKDLSCQCGWHAGSTRAVWICSL